MLLDIEPQCLMIHVKLPKVFLSEIENEKRIRENSILRCGAPKENDEEYNEEETLDIFQNIKGIE